MAKLTGLPAQGIIDGFKGHTDFYINMGIPCARSWPRPPTEPRSLAVQGTWPAFSYINRIASSLPAAIVQAYKDMAVGSGAHWKDYLCRAYIMGIAGIAKLNPLPGAPSITEYFLINQIYQDRLPTGWKTVFTTDTACTMLLFWSHMEPRKNFTYRRRRGLSILAMAEFGFVYVRKSWQREPNDSYTHTFYFLSMPEDQTRWFGTIAWKSAWLMRSTSPIFHVTRDHGWQWPVIIETWDNGYVLPPEMDHVIIEHWTFPGPPSFTLYLDESWSTPSADPPSMDRLLDEPWTIFFDPPAMVLLLDESWSPPSPDPPAMIQMFIEEWHD